MSKAPLSFKVKEYQIQKQGSFHTNKSIVHILFFSNYNRMIRQYVSSKSLKACFTRVMYWEGRIIIDTHEFRSLVENVFVFICYSTWWRTCSRSLPLSLICLITCLRGSKSTPNNLEGPNKSYLTLLPFQPYVSISVNEELEMEEVPHPWKVEDYDPLNQDHVRGVDCGELARKAWVGLEL